MVSTKVVAVAVSALGFDTGSCLGLTFIPDSGVSVQFSASAESQSSPDVCSVVHLYRAPECETTLVSD